MAACSMRHASHSRGKGGNLACPRLGGGELVSLSECTLAHVDLHMVSHGYYPYQPSIIMERGAKIEVACGRGREAWDARLRDGVREGAGR